MAGRRPKDQRRADYFLYTWQIRAIRRLAEERHEPPSQVVRELLSQALGRPECAARDKELMLLL